MADKITDNTPLVRIRTDEPTMLPDTCTVNRSPDPCSIIIFGASGDLTKRKMIPSLFNLYKSGGLPERFSIVGCGRTELDDRGFRSILEDALTFEDEAERAQWNKFADALHYQPVVYDGPGSYKRLGESLHDLDRKHKTGENRIFYLALPPALYRPVAQMLGQAGLGKGSGKGWVRLVVEKPFGRDLETAIDLDRGLHTFFDEHQIFRIDHYLAKETVQNVLMFRFANAIFEPIWNRRYIEYVDITATETLGVEHRAGYYEQSGVLRDMFQNHMMQLLALTAMEPPSRFEAELVRDERVKVFRALRPFTTGNLQKSLALGQYVRGSRNGREVPGYREEPGVDPQSTTPTYARMRVFVDNWRWQGVPFYLTSGKRLADKITRIAIQFREVPHSMFRSILGESINANRLIIGIYPEEKITLTFQTKNPGAVVCLRSVTMDFHYQQETAGQIMDAYEKVLVDCMLGDQMLFWRQDAVELCWSFLTPILSGCETGCDKNEMLRPYEAFSWGPQEAGMIT